MMKETLTNINMLTKAKQNKRIALIYHIGISDSEEYEKWFEICDSLLNKFAGKRVYGISVDPAPREDLAVNEIFIYEFPSHIEAAEFFSKSISALNHSSDNVTVVAICPEPKIKMLIVRCVSKVLQIVKGISDPEVPTNAWKPNNDRVWPDENQISVARKQNPNEPILVYNLNKNKKIAQYAAEHPSTPSCSGEDAYERYSKIAGPLLLRRGAFPVYGGKPIGFIYGQKNMLYDTWSKFILVHYPQRRNLLSMIESAEYKSSQYHRDAGLERVAIFIGNYKK